MSKKLIALFLVTLAFGVLTTLALLEGGVWGIIAPHFRSWGGAQVFTDLVILAVLTCVWMVHDARRHRLAAWPFVLLTLLAGSFGPLVYLCFREAKEAQSTLS
ncbi:MAG: DUF2834 domain-containing protein [Bryobacteraceae bacterium]|nr:DUF2834 domain-containing protein [Bryobacteraceae bacterium]